MHEQEMPQPRQIPFSILQKILDLIKKKEEG